MYARPVYLLKINVDKFVLVYTVARNDLLSLSFLFTDNCQSLTEAGAVSSDVGTVQPTTSTASHSLCVMDLGTGGHAYNIIITFIVLFSVIQCIYILYMLLYYYCIFIKLRIIM